MTKMLSGTVPLPEQLLLKINIDMWLSDKTDMWGFDATLLFYTHNFQLVKGKNDLKKCNVWNIVIPFTKLFFK